MKAGRLALAALASAIFAGPALAADTQRTIDPQTLPPDQREQALTAPLGQYGPFGEPADPGCLWSRIATPTPEGVRWLLEEECSDLGTQAPREPYPDQP